MYNVTVVGIQEAADNFQRQHGGTGTVWCHNLDLVVEVTGEQVPCQMCTDFPKVSEFEPNQRIKIQAGKLTKGRTSVKFIEKLPPLRKGTSAPANDPPVFEGRNPVVAGTAMDRALYNACHLYQMQGTVDLDKIEAAAIRFYQLLVDHTPQ